MSVPNHHSTQSNIPEECRSQIKKEYISYRKVYANPNRYKKSLPTKKCCASKRVVPVKLTVLSAGRWLSGPITIRPAYSFSEAHQVEARVATVSGPVPEESSDQRHGSQLRTRQLLAFPLCRHNTTVQHK